jgi:diguanylate cyclase (GGDEF)-like protein
MEVILDISKEINFTLDLKTILDYTTLTVIGQLGITSASIMIRDESDEAFLKIASSKGLIDAAPAQDFRININSKFVNKIMELKKVTKLEKLYDPRSPEEEIKKLSETGARFCVPLVKKDNIIGILNLGSKLSNEEMSKDEKEFISVLSSLAAIAIDNAFLYKTAITDVLTTLYTRRYFDISINKQLSQTKKSQKELALIMLDIDSFSLINNTYGHQTGDTVLRGLGKIIWDNIMGKDIPSRYGGEEFTIIIPNNNTQDTIDIAEKIRKTMSGKKFTSIEGQSISVTVSLGIAFYPKNGETPEDIIKNADNAMITAKNSGKNQTVVA